MIYIHEVLSREFKIHKTLEDGIPLFCPILSLIGTPKYKLDKICDQLFKPLTNKYKIKDSLLFAEEVLEFDASLFMASFDIKSLFINIPLT